MAWIKTIPFSEATGKLKELYKQVVSFNNSVDNVVTMHSLRPHTLEAHLSLYRAVLHHPDNTLPRWYLEALGTYVSYLNNCHYCFTHHSRGMQRELGSELKSEQLLKAIREDSFKSTFLTQKEILGFEYARSLTKDPTKMDSNLILEMRESGIPDSEILEMNQVISYFAYVNRTVIGLGCSLEDSNQPGD
jgi:uncharacterized peroxidase-related enzyme